MKILAIVQARMGSSRLPSKVMRQLDGHPMIYQTLTRLRESRYIDQVILATSTKEADTPLSEYAVSIGFEVFRGDEDNVLERYKLAVDKYQGDIVIRVTGDCPLIDPVLVDHAITKYMVYDYDYIRLDVPNTFVRGFDVEVFSKAALDKTYDIVCVQNDKTREDFKPFREHVTYYIYNHLDEFKVGSLIGEGDLVEKAKLEINLSVDTLEDFKRVEERIHIQGYRKIIETL